MKFLIFKEFPDDTKASEGETVFFTVQVAGYPEPTWVCDLHGRATLTRRQYSDIPRWHNLIIKDIGTDSSGVYSVYC